MPCTVVEPARITPSESIGQCVRRVGRPSRAREHEGGNRSDLHHIPSSRQETTLAAYPNSVHPNRRETARAWRQRLLNNVQDRHRKIQKAEKRSRRSELEP